MVAETRLSPVQIEILNTVKARLNQWPEGLGVGDAKIDRAIRYSATIMLPFLEQLIRSGLSAKTITRHTNNLAILLNEQMHLWRADESSTPKSVKETKDSLLSHCSENEGPYLDSPTQDSFNCTCGKFYRFCHQL